MDQTRYETDLYAFRRAWISMWFGIVFPAKFQPSWNLCICNWLSNRGHLLQYLVFSLLIRYSLYLFSININDNVEGFWTCGLCLNKSCLFCWRHLCRKAINIYWLFVICLSVLWSLQLHWIANNYFLICFFIAVCMLQSIAEAEVLPGNG